MPHLLLPVLALAAGLRAEGCVQGAPCYSEAGIVNSASSEPGPLSANALATLYGSDLSFNTRAVAPSDMQGGRMPVKLGGVVLSVDGESAALYYVSPTQINFAVPYTAVASTVTVRVMREGRAGPAVRVAMADAAPAFFLRGEWICGSHADGTPLAPEAPADAGETVILYATGLGALLSDGSQPPSEAPSRASPLVRSAAFRAELGGRELEPKRILYAGAAPGFLGLYQINLTLPEELPETDEIRAGFEGRMSKPAHLPLRRAPAATEAQRTR